MVSIILCRTKVSPLKAGEDLERKAGTNSKPKPQTFRTNKNTKRIIKSIK